jgi:hypothetical protein
MLYFMSNLWNYKINIKISHYLYKLHWGPPKTHTHTTQSHNSHPKTCAHLSWPPLGTVLTTTESDRNPSLGADALHHPRTRSLTQVVILHLWSAPGTVLARAWQSQRGLLTGWYNIYLHCLMDCLNCGFGVWIWVHFGNPLHLGSNHLHHLQRRRQFTWPVNHSATKLCFGEVYSLDLWVGVWIWEIFQWCRGGKELLQGKRSYSYLVNCFCTCLYWDNYVNTWLPCYSWVMVFVSQYFG